MEIIYDITNVDYCKTFRQTFDVLLQKLGALDEYNLFQTNGHEVILNSNYENYAMCNHISAVQEHLLFFNVLMNQMDSGYQCFDELKYLIILIYFKNTELIFNNDDKKFKLKNNIALVRIIRTTVNAIQHIELNNCKTSEINKDIIHRSIRKYSYTGIDLSKTSGRFNIRNILIRLAFKTRIYRPRNAKKIINYIIDKYIFKDILKNENGVYAKEMQFVWYRLQKNIYQIGQDILQSIVDYRRIVKFLCLVQKWLVFKIFIQLGYIFKFPKNLTYYNIEVILK